MGGAHPGELVFGVVDDLRAEDHVAEARSLRRWVDAGEALVEPGGEGSLHRVILRAGAPFLIELRLAPALPHRRRSARKEMAEAGVGGLPQHRKRGGGVAVAGE